MKKFFKRFGVVFLAVMFLFCSSVSVFAADVPDQIETTTVDSSMIEDVNPIMPVDDETELDVMYYVPSGWTCEAGTFSGSELDRVGVFLFFCDSGSILVCNNIMIGYEYVDGSFVEKADSIVVGFSIGGSFSLIETLTPDSDFSGIFVYSGDGFFDFFESHGILLLFADSVTEEIIYINDDLLYDTYSISAGWSLPAGYYGNRDISSSFYLNGILYEDYFIYLGYSFADDGLIETENSIVFFNEFSGDVIQLTSEDSFTLRNFGLNYDLTYFMLHNGTIMPPTLLESIFDIFLSIGEWISGATSALVSMFWDSTNSTLTFVGTLSVAGLAISVSFLLISFLEKFLRFGG